MAINGVEYLAGSVATWEILLALMSVTSTFSLYSSLYNSICYTKNVTHFYFLIFFFFQ